MPDDEKSRLNERYPSNSLTARRNPKEKAGAETINRRNRSIEGKAREPKKSLGVKFLENFFATNLQEIGRYLLYDVAIPLAKDSWLDMWSMLLKGDRVSGRFSRDRDRTTVRTSYNSYYDGRNRKDERERDRAPRRNDGHYNLLFDTRSEAEDVLEWLMEDLEDYEVVSVAEMYSYAKLDADYTMRRYGWGNLEEAHIERVPEGFLLRMPRATVIK